jgi:hypothetical protein
MKNDPCKKKEDPCKKKEDPCKKKNDDPCKKKDPCKKATDARDFSDDLESTLITSRPAPNFNFFRRFNAFMFHRLFSAKYNLGNIVYGVPVRDLSSKKGGASSGKCAAGQTKKPKKRTDIKARHKPNESCYKEEGADACDKGEGKKKSIPTAGCKTVKHTCKKPKDE